MSKQDSRDEKRKAKEAADYYTAGAAHGGSVRILCLVLNCESVGTIAFKLRISVSFRWGCSSASCDLC